MIFWKLTARMITYNNEFYYLLYRAHYQWYQLNPQNPHEITLFKNFDSSPRNGVTYKFALSHGKATGGQGALY